MRVNSELNCLLLYPYSFADSQVLKLITDILQHAGISPILPHQMIAPGSDLARGVLKLIERADFIIADVTESNPNVMFEIGYAQALRKPVLLILKEGSPPISSVLAGEIYLIYDLAQPERLLQYIGAWVNRYQRAA
jgi:hypothetical protein